LSIKDQESQVFASNAYWERWNQLHSQMTGKVHSQMTGKVHRVIKAVAAALEETPIASSMVETLNSRSRNYFFLRLSLGDDYLNLLQFFLNHRCCPTAVYFGRL